MMKDFIFFNQRLTSKLNAIYRHPFTIVAGKAGVGKTFTLSNYLASRGADVLWHMSEDIGLKDFLYALADRFGFICNEPEICDLLGELENRPLSVSADRAASLIRKKRGYDNQVYVLDYLGKQHPEEIVQFLYYLSGQRISGLYFIVCLRFADAIKDMMYLDFGVNYISEECFLLTPAELREAFLRNGIDMKNEETNLIYLYSKGFMPAVKRLIDDMKERNKAVVLSEAGIIVRQFFSLSDEEGKNESTDWKCFENISLYCDGLDEVRLQIGKGEIKKAGIALAGYKMRAEPYSEEYDLICYLEILLTVYKGEAIKPLIIFNEGFEERIRMKRWESAYRMILASVQFLIISGESWKNEKSDIVRVFTDRRISEGTGISEFAAVIALFVFEDYYRMLAYLETVDWKGPQKCSQELLLAAVYIKLNYTGEADEHMERGFRLAVEENLLLPIIQFYWFFPDEVLKYKDKSFYRDIIDSESFRAKITELRRVMRRVKKASGENSNNVLTLREREILGCLEKGLSNKEIAAQLNISENTVKSIIKKVYSKLKVSSRKDLMHVPAEKL